VSLSQGDVCSSCPGSAGLGILLPHLAGVIVEEVVAAAGLLLVLARARAPEAACPECGTASGRVHSRYSRKLADAAIGGRQVEILLAVRRFFCLDPGCGRKTFAEQVDGLTTRYARKTPLLVGVLGRIAVAGRAGGIAAGLRPGRPRVPAGPAAPGHGRPGPRGGFPRVLGVDDFAIRRGQHYGTLLIGIETGAPLDLIEGRDAQPLADWLSARPGVEVICRDRSGAYADGARTGAPDAVQVADRFHLWQNLAKAMEKCVAAHRACLAEPALPAADDDAAPAETPAPADPSGKFADRARRKHELVRALRAEGRGLREIARHLGWGLHTVQGYDRAATWQELAESRWPTKQPSKLDPFKPYLDQHAGEGHGSFTRLFHEIKELGYDGSYSVVRNYLDQARSSGWAAGTAINTVSCTMYRVQRERAGECPMPTEHSSGGDPARTLQLLWRDPGAADSRRGPRQSLSVERVAAAAIALADSDGLGSVTMRAVAHALGVVPMSLYTYVPGKAELLDLMLDTVYCQMLRGDLSDMPWRERLAAVAQENRDLFTRHPWTAGVSTSRPPLGPGLMAKYEHEISAFEDLGLDDVEMDAALTFLLGFVQAAARSAAEAAAARQDSAMSEAQWWAANAPLLARVFDEAKYPTASRVGAAHGAAHDPDHAYTFGLQRVLDGLGALIDTSGALIDTSGA
jgi:AcrR family transcriptional regulator